MDGSQQAQTQPMGAIRQKISQWEPSGERYSKLMKGHRRKIGKWEPAGERSANGSMQVKNWILGDKS